MDKIKGIKEYYNDTANEWANKWYTDETMLPLLKKFISLYKTKPKILDAGCGAGYESMRLYNLGVEVVGIDISEESINIAKNNNPNCKFELLNCLELNESLGSFDGIMAIALIVHIENKNLNIVFKNFKKIIKINGYVFIAFVEGIGFSEKRSYLEINGEKYNRSFYLHPINEIIEIANIFGFKYVDEWFLEENIGDWKFIVFQYSNV